MIELTFYHSFLCPRCHRSRKALLRVLADHPEIRLREMDVSLHPIMAMREGIRMFPACRIEDRILSGFLLSEKGIRSFIDKAGDRAA